MLNGAVCQREYQNAADPGYCIVCESSSLTFQCDAMLNLSLLQYMIVWGHQCCLEIGIVTKESSSGLHSKVKLKTTDFCNFFTPEKNGFTAKQTITRKYTFNHVQKLDLKNVTGVLSTRIMIKASMHNLFNKQKDKVTRGAPCTPYSNTCFQCVVYFCQQPFASVWKFSVKDSWQYCREGLQREFAVQCAPTALPCYIQHCI